MDRLIKYFNNNRILSFAIVFTSVFILYITLILSRASACFTLEVGSNSLGLSFSYTKEMVQSFFEFRNQDQLICYGQFLKIWDSIFAIIYTLMYASWIAYFLQIKSLFLIIPLLAMTCDWTENYIELIMLETYLRSNFISETFVFFGSGINSLKWILSTLTYLIIFFGIIITLKNLLKKNKKISI